MSEVENLRVVNSESAPGFSRYQQLIEFLSGRPTGSETPVNIYATRENSEWLVLTMNAVWQIKCKALGGIKGDRIAYEEVSDASVEVRQADRLRLAYFAVSGTSKQRHFISMGTANGHVPSFERDWQRILSRSEAALIQMRNIANSGRDLRGLPPVNW